MDMKRQNNEKGRNHRIKTDGDVRIPVNSAMTKAAAPITEADLTTCEAVASTAQAKGGLNPVRFIRGMVSHPSTITLATALPEMVPNSALEMHEIFPGPPRVQPVMAEAKSMKSCPVPDFSKKVPKTMKRMT
jgi:hypothetical protein